MEIKENNEQQIKPDDQNKDTQRNTYLSNELNKNINMLKFLNSADFTANLGGKISE